MRCAKDSGGCAEGVGVLDAGVIFHVRSADGAAREEAAEFAGDESGAGVAAGFVEAFIEEGIAGAAAIDGHGGGEQRSSDQLLDVVGDEGTTGGHEVGAINEGEAFFGGESEGLNAGTLEDGCGGDWSVVDQDMALADEDVGNGGEGGEVA